MKGECMTKAELRKLKVEFLQLIWRILNSDDEATITTIYVTARCHETRLQEQQG